MRALINRTWSFAVLLFAVGLYTVGLRGYYANYYLVAAKRGEKSMTDYERLLQRSIAYDKHSGLANAEMAIYRLARRDVSAALNAHERSMVSYRPVHAFEQFGNLQERLAVNQPEARRNELISLATENYAKARRMNPGYIPALERLMVQAYRRGDQDRVEDLASDLARLDWENRNGLYLRALLEEANGSFASASALLQRVVAGGEGTQGALYRLEEVKQRLKDVQARTAAGS